MCCNNSYLEEFIIVSKAVMKHLCRPFRFEHIQHHQDNSQKQSSNSCEQHQPPRPSKLWLQDSVLERYLHFWIVYNYNPKGEAGKDH